MDIIRVEEKQTFNGLGQKERKIGKAPKNATYFFKMSVGFKILEENQIFLETKSYEKEANETKITT